MHGLDESKRMVVIKDEIKKYINEDINKEVDKLKKYGYSVVERVDVGDYHIILFKHVVEGFYEVALTSKNKDFTTPTSQEKIPNKGSDLMTTTNRFISVLREWVNKYKPLYIGSLNKDKTTKYHKLLERFGFNVSDIEHNPPSGPFPESWVFMFK